MQIVKIHDNGNAEVIQRSVTNSQAIAEVARLRKALPLGSSVYFKVIDGQASIHQAF